MKRSSAVERGAGVAVGAAIALWSAVMPVVAGTPTMGNATCPVLPAEQAKPQFFTEYRGQRVNFCCRFCREKFLKNPSAYVANLPVPPAAGESEVADATASAGGEAHDMAGVAGHRHAGAADADEHGEHAHGAHGSGHDRGWGRRGLDLFGRLHPAVVHFPIALLLTALLAEAVAAVAGCEIFAATARVTLPLGVLGGWVSAAAGWTTAAAAGYPASVLAVVARHRWLGVATVIVATAAWILQTTAISRDDRRWTMAYRVALTLAGGLVGAAGYFGGVLTHGADHFAF